MKASEFKFSCIKQVVQAALMAQAALVRGQAQAQAAIMFNPKNIQAMAEHMGIRQHYNPNKQGNRVKHGSNNTSPPTVKSPSEGGKWFGEFAFRKLKSAVRNNYKR